MYVLRATATVGVFSAEEFIEEVKSICFIHGSELVYEQGSSGFSKFFRMTIKSDNLEKLKKIEKKIRI